VNSLSFSLVREIKFARTKHQICSGSIQMCPVRKLDVVEHEIFYHPAHRPLTITIKKFQGDVDKT
jgi:hypothetical protein